MYNLSSPRRLVYRTNELWASRVTGIHPMSNNDSPDLMNDDVFIEVKSGTNKNNWTLVGKRQFEYLRTYAPRHGLLMLVIYRLGKDPNLLTTITNSSLERCVESRTGYVLPFSAIDSLAINSRKHHDYKYPDELMKSHPVVQSFTVEKGTLHICMGADISDLSVKGEKIEIHPS